MRTSILIVDPNRMLRQGLRSLFHADGEFEVAGEAGDAALALQHAQSLHPDIVLLDSQLPGAPCVALVSQLRLRNPDIGIVMLTVTLSDGVSSAACGAMADALVPKDASFEELRHALRSVAAGEPHPNPALVSTTRSDLAAVSVSDSAAPLLAKLTPRERSILELIAQGRTNRAAAGQLHVSQKTVEKHRANLMRKLGVHNATELMFMATDLGLVGRPNFARRPTLSVGFEARAGAL
jgi:DNA-binding NarL/FixJ family response regulator